MSAAPADAPAAWRVVVIDDSADDRAEIRRLLLRGSERRYLFTEAQTGTTGVAAVMAGAALPDCVLLDYNLPDMDALEVLAALTGLDGLPVCPVVVLTGGAGLETGRLVLRAGAQDYIGKDWLTPPGLTRTVENAIERLAMGRELLLRNAALRSNEKKLSEADRRKDQFIATLAHELRNPLAPIRTGLQVLRLTPDARSAQQTMDTMERQLGQMTRLIDDLLDVSRITSGKMLLRIERVCLKEIVDGAVEAVLPLLAGGRQSLAVDLSRTPLWLDADPLRLAQVIGNLLNNAAKYSPDGGKIGLSARRDADAVVIEVTDEGVGIPPDMLGRVFDMFTQVGRTLDLAQGGLGIGLALVRRLVEMHGGSVIAQSGGMGRGCTFTIRLPVAVTPLRPVIAGAPDAGPVARPSRRILVVDDNQDSADLLAMMLGLSGHQTCTAYTGPDALATACDFLPEVVFLDIGLPGMNGYEVVRRFRATPQLRRCMLVALTGWGSQEDRRRSSDAGFDFHLTKPVEPGEIDKVMARYEIDRATAK